ncbi:MAG: DUF4139 domain-containing protein, partial [candidate division Zixibacteria bacterium]|nr:DUF4139 domain-containing protein [candidate division Zixibacteria bacterium]
YNSNLGVVSEIRSLEFKKGVGQLAYTDVPSQIDAASVRFDLVGSKDGVSILEQNYAYDLVSPEQMYAKYIDEEIELIDKEGKLYTGTLLAFSGGAVTLKEKSGRIKIVRMDNVVETNFPSLPEGLITRPTLFWQYNSDLAGKLNCNVAYQTSGMNWSAEYVGVLSADEKNLDLSGWASINNVSGKTFADAKLKLIAGDIHRAAPAPKKALRGGMALAEMGYAGFEEKAFFEYHMYTLPRKATLKDKEIKQISLFEPATTSVTKGFIYRPERNATRVEVALKFVNSAAAGLGMPLPEGRVRLFQADEDGSLVLLGEDIIDHTPKNEELDLMVGYAFDIIAEETLLNQRQISSRVDERDYRIKLNNRKTEAVSVKVEKRLNGYWEVVKANLEYNKKDANTLVFNVPIEADQSTVIEYTVRFTRR